MKDSSAAKIDSVSVGWLGPRDPEKVRAWARLWKRMSQKLLRKIDALQKESADHFSEAMRWADDCEEATTLAKSAEETLSRHRLGIKELIEDVVEEMNKKIPKIPRDSYNAGKIQAYGEVLVLLRAKEHALKNKEPKTTTQRLIDG